MIMGHESPHGACLDHGLALCLGVPPRLNLFICIQNHQRGRVTCSDVLAAEQREPEDVSITIDHHGWLPGAPVRRVL